MHTSNSFLSCIEEETVKPFHDLVCRCVCTCVQGRHRNMRLPNWIDWPCTALEMAVWWISFSGISNHVWWKWFVMPGFPHLPSFLSHPANGEDLPYALVLVDACQWDLSLIYIWLNAHYCYYVCFWHAYMLCKGTRPTQLHLIYHFRQASLFSSLLIYCHGYSLA